MKRVLLAVTGTVAGLVALLSFKTHGTGVHSAALPSTGLPAASISSTTTAEPASTAGSSPAATTAPTTSPTPATATTRAKASTSSSATSVRSATGQAEQTRYGVVQVKVTVTGSTITNVSFVQLTGNDPRSDEINSEAAPILLQETLQAQGANINGVSGASFTSQGYIASLQSALDQL